MKAPTTTAPDDLGNAVRNEWRRGAKPDVAAALVRYPELRNHDSVVIDLIYEEFCLRRQKGEKIDKEAFCARYPDYDPLVYDLLAMDRQFGDHPSYFDKMQDDPPPPPAAPKPAGEDVAWPEGAERFSDFTLIRELGRGGFSRVYLATEASTGGRPVAVKLSRVRTQEARTLGRLDHDHIIPVLWADYDEASRLQVVCMPFLGSATLEDVLYHIYPYRGATPPAKGAVIVEAVRELARPSDPLPDRFLSGPDFSRLSFVDAVLQLGENLAGALAFLRERKLLHRDLKPANILLTPAGRPLLLDFNLSVADHVATTTAAGTFDYMAPEQVAAAVAKKSISIEESCKSDLYALGVILYQLLTGRHPLGNISGTKNDDEQALETLKRQKQPIQPVRELNPAVPVGVAELLHRCLSFDPQARPDGAKALADELRRVRRRRRPVLAAACSMLFAGIALLALAATVKSYSAPAPLSAPTIADPGFLRSQAKEQLTQGWQLVRAGKPAEAREFLQNADEHFAHAIDATIRNTGASRGDWEDYAGRGRAKMLLGQYTDALMIFGDADGILRRLPSEQKPADSRLASLTACRSYCYSQKGDHLRAVKSGEEVIKAGYPSAALFNNIGYSCLQKPDLDKAEKYLAEAMRLEPNLLPALRNRMMLALTFLSLKNPKKKLAVPNWFREQLDVAMPQRIAQGCSEPAIIYQRGASLFSRWGDGEQARNYVSLACRLGANPAEFKADPYLRKDKELQEWLRSVQVHSYQPAAPGSSLDFWLIDPLADAAP